MSTPAATPEFGDSAIGVSQTRETVRDIAGSGGSGSSPASIWLIASFVILQFDKASITTIGVLVGCMFLFAGVQQLVLAAVARPHCAGCGPSSACSS